MKYPVTVPPSSTSQVITVDIPEVSPTHTVTGTTPIDPPTDPNLSPTVNAGSDVTITLPINSVILNGSAVDKDGTIVGYEWTKLSVAPSLNEY